MFKAYITLNKASAWNNVEIHMCMYSYEKSVQPKQIYFVQEETPAEFSDIVLQWKFFFFQICFVEPIAAGEETVIGTKARTGRLNLCSHTPGSHQKFSLIISEQGNFRRVH